MHNLPFETYNIGGSALQMLEDAYRVLQQNYPIAIPASLGIDINQFDCTKIEGSAIELGSVMINGCYLTLIENKIVRSNYRAASVYIDCLHQFWAFVKLKRDFGRILIRRETFTDKVLEVLHPIELDFTDDKPFSDKFYVITNDKEKAMLNMTTGFRNAIFDMPAHWMIEIVGADLLVYNSPIDAIGATELIAFAGKIARLR
jgi:hypothetical protein